MRALIIGATGATGKDLVDVMLQDPAYTEVVIFVRRPTGIKNPKLIEVLTDFEKLENVSDKIKGDVWFSCLGTTLKIAGSKENQRHIEYDIPLRFAEIAKSNGVPTVVLLSAYSASAKSNVFYSRVKGELEDSIIKLAFRECYIFRPGLLVRKNTDRFGERIAEKVINLLNSVGILRGFRPMPTQILAEKLAKAGKANTAKKIVVGNEIFDY